MPMAKKGGGRGMFIRILENQMNTPLAKRHPYFGAISPSADGRLLYSFFIMELRLFTI
jgi:hypothetical protein